MAEIQMTTVPHRGGAESIMAVVSGDVQAVFSDVVPAVPPIKEGLVFLPPPGPRRDHRIR
jgi:tripartite-type tricarboxylate transporter receptor subunit TctC